MYAAVGCGYHGTLDPSCPLEPNHPTNLGIVAEWAVAPLSGWWGGLTLRDMVRGMRSPHDGIKSGGATWGGGNIPGSYGTLNFDGSSGVVTAATSIGLDYSKITVAASINMLGSLSGGSRYTVLDTSGSNVSGCPSFEVQAASSSTYQLQALIPGVFLIGPATGTVFSTSLPVEAVWVINNGAGTASAYGNGALAASGSAGAQTFDSGSRPALIGQRSNGAQFWPGHIGSVRIFNRVLTATQIAALYDQTRRGNPDRWRWIKGTEYSFPSAGGGDHPLTASAAAFTLSGLAATLRAARALTLAPASILLTGTASTLVAARKLTAAPASVVETGKPATLLATRKMTSSPGSLTLTGSAGTLTAARRLSASPGAFTLTGTSTTLVYSAAGGFTFTAGTGSFAWTGSPASPVRGRPLTAASASSTLTGSPLSAAAARRLSAGVGVYHVSGSPTVLSWSGLTFTVRIQIIKGWDGTVSTLKGYDGTKPTIKGDNL